MAKGGYGGDDGRFDVKHSVALAMDGAEGFGGKDKVRMRLVLSEQEVPPSALTGLAFPPIWTQGRTGKVKGFLLEFDPADQTNVVITVLAQPEPGYSLTTRTLSNSEGVWKTLNASPTRISGELKDDLNDDMRFSFSAPVFTNAVVANLTGPAAAASEPVKVLVARAQALQKGDIPTVLSLSTEGAVESFGKLDPEMLKMIRRELPGMIQKLKAPRRVVIRRETAAVQLDKDSWASAVLVNGVWKGTD